MGRRGQGFYLNVVGYKEMLTAVFRSAQSGFI